METKEEEVPKLETKDEEVPKLETKDEEVPKYDIIIKNGVKHFEPDIMSFRRASEDTIFPVPLPNAVGTLGYSSISLIEFNDISNASADYLVMPRMKICGIDLLYQLSPNFSDDTIVFSKTRIVIIVNIKTGKMFPASFGLSSDDYIRGISFLDPQNNLLVIVVSEDDINDPLTDSLHLAKLEGRRLIDLGIIIEKCYEGGDYSSDIKKHNYWLVHDRILFVHDDLRSKNMLAFNGLTETSHPFAKIFNDNKEKIRDLRNFAIHPYLPFGILVEYGSKKELLAMSDEIFNNIIQTHPLHILRWNTDDPDEQFASFNQKLLPLIPFFENVKHLAFTYPSFSPDGKWLVLGCFQHRYSQHPHFIAIPIDPDNPEFLNIDELIILGKVAYIEAIAWSTAPTSFVVGTTGALYKWNLEELRNARTITVPKQDDGKNKKDKNKKPSFFKRLLFKP